MWYCNIKARYDLQLVKSQMEVEVYTGLSPNKFSFDLEVMVFPDIKAITEFFANIFHFSYATMDISRAFISALLSPKNMITLHSCGKTSQICKTLLGVFKPPCILCPEPRTKFSVSTSILRCQKMLLKKKKKKDTFLVGKSETSISTALICIISLPPAETSKNTWQNSGVLTTWSLSGLCGQITLSIVLAVREKNNCCLLDLIKYKGPYRIPETVLLHLDILSGPLNRWNGGSIPLALTFVLCLLYLVMLALHFCKRMTKIAHSQRLSSQAWSLKVYHFSLI